MREIKTIQDVQRLEFGIAQVELLQNEFAMLTLPTIVNQQVIDLIQYRMQSNNFSKKIIDRTFLEKIVINDGEADVHVISDYESEEGFDVAKAREEGTVDHDIVPKVQGPRAKRGRNEQQTDQTRDIPDSQQVNHPVALSWIVNGIRLYSKGHRVSGIPALRLIETTIREKAEIVQQLYYEQETTWAMEKLEGS